MDISIIIPFRNEADYIEECLRSIFENEFPRKNFEVLVIDGMSTDSSADIAKKTMKRHKNIRFFKNKEKIFSTGANIGIKNAKGNVLVFLSGHARIAPNFIKNTLKVLEETMAGCAGGPMETVGKTKIGRIVAAALSSPFGVGNAYFRYGNKAQYVDTLAYGAYRKNIFKRIGVFNTRLVRNQDIELNARLRKNGGRIFFSPKIKTYYHSRDSLKKLWKQGFENAFWCMNGGTESFQYLGIRHYVPLVFVTILIFSLFFVHSLFWGVLALYFAVSLLFSLQISLKKNFKYFLPLPIVFFTLHVAYGIGSLWGLIRYYLK